MGSRFDGEFSERSVANPEGPCERLTDASVGKRVWLRPGKKYLFGRIKQDDGLSAAALSLSLLRIRLVLHVVEHKSISRKHLTIQVSEVQPRDGVRLPTRLS